MNIAKAGMEIGQLKMIKKNLGKCILHKRQQLWHGIKYLLCKSGRLDAKQLRVDRVNPAYKHAVFFKLGA